MSGMPSNYCDDSRVAVIRCAESDVTSVGGGGSTGVEALQECLIPHLERAHGSA